MQQHIRRLSTIPLLTITTLASAYSPICPGKNIEWLAHLPINGPIRSIQLQIAPRADFLNATPEQRDRLPIYAHATFDEHGALTTLVDLNGDTHTYTNANGLRVATRTNRADGTQEFSTVTYRQYDDQGRPTEYAITTATQDAETRTTYKITYFSDDYHRIEATTYLEDGTITTRETDTLNHCLSTERSATFDNGSIEVRHIYWTGPDQIHVIRNQQIDAMREVFYLRPKGSTRPRSQLTQRHVERSIAQRDEYGNPTIFVYSELAQSFDDWVAQNPRVHKITYDYYD